VAEAAAEPGLLLQDVRHERELEHRRHLAATTRRVLRVGSLVVLDLGVLAVAALAAQGLTAGEPAGWYGILPYMLALQVLSIAAVNGYGFDAGRTDSRAHFQAILLAVAVLVLIGWIDAGLSVPPLQLAIYAGLAAVGLHTERAAVQGVVQRLRRQGHLCRPALVVGSASEASEVMEYLQARRNADFLYVGHVSEDHEPTTLGRVDELAELIERHDVRVVVVTESVAAARVTEVVSRSFNAGAAVITVPGTARRAAWRLSAHSSLGAGVMELYPPRLRVPQFALKRALDVTVASGMLLALSPVLMLIAVAIRLDSPGPILFQQIRLGVRGRPFGILKFRTMAVDADHRKGALAHLNESGDPRLFKIPADPRVTRVGRLLRTLSLDELPQLVNVLRGEMSIVGPRPFFPQDVDRYQPHHLERLTVLPGITGLWQVSGRSDILDFERVVTLDNEYIRSWSVLLDLKIMVKTIPTILRGHGAY
jgi:exopolysaccharide biosynthesis polyprenyl glycosylphosphotransferase